ncbi:hypothetical protein [Spirillospora sp. NPDC047279]|uniref:hypothetical protein n=1 Tax=Spirillospora sp. NPDC047279 TaxID=3155478 RepID=UPI0033DF11C7
MKPDEPDLLANSPFKGDLEAELAAAPRPRALPGATAYLAAGVLLVAGFLGGVQAEKAWSNDDSAIPRAGAYPGAAGGNRPYGGGPPGNAFGGGQNVPGNGGQNMPGNGGTRGNGFGGQMTTGTVVKVSGDTVYLRTADGKTVTVKTSGSTEVQVTKAGALKDLKSGAAITVRGATGQDGSVTATTINQGGSTQTRRP